jgi:hypothetical protein
MSYINLNQKIGRLQGAKVLGGFLYATSDNATKSIYKISLIDGSVTEVLRLSQYHNLQGGYAHELEGLSALHGTGGDTLNILLTHGNQQQPLTAHTLFLQFINSTP